MNQELISALEKSASPVSSQRQSGEAELQALEAHPGFNVSLVSILCDPGIKNSSRYLALIFLKNQVERKWRRPNVFSSESKQILRQSLFEAVTMPAIVQHVQMVKQLSVILAEIARQDFPRQWPSFLNDLHALVLHYGAGANTVVNSISDSKLESITITLEAVLEVMHRALKKIGTTRFGPARVQFDEFSIQNVAVYWELFKAYNQYKALKICGTLLSLGNPRAHRYEQPQLVFHEMTLALRSIHEQDNIKLTLRVAKIMYALVEKHPRVFSGFKLDCTASGQFYLEFLLNSTQKPCTEPKLLVQAMCIVRELARFVQYEKMSPNILPMSMRVRDETDRKESECSFTSVRNIFNENDLLPLLVRALINFYFAMTQDDLDLWQNCPEEFVIEESSQSPEVSVVLCAELLFAHILKTWPEVVAPLAQHLIEEAVQSGNELRTEAALRALQFGAQTFSKSFDIGPVVKLLVENGGVNSSSPIIRRRLCLVIGGWIPVKSTFVLQMIAFNLVRSTLETAEWDIVVRLGALELAGICCDDIEFDQSLFCIASEPLLRTIYTLLQPSQSSTEIKIHVLKTLTLVIQGMAGYLSSDDVLRVLEILPTLWGNEVEHSDHHLVQGAVLQTLTELINASAIPQQNQANPSRLTTGFDMCLKQAYIIAVPLVEISTDPKQPLAEYLMEDALALWKALLVNSEQADKGISDLFERCVTLIELNTEELGLHMGILESYLWLSYGLAEPFYNRILSNFSLYLNESCSFNDALLILLCTEILLNVSDGRHETAALQQSGLIQWMQKCIIQADDQDAPMETLIEASKCLNILSLISLKTGGEGVVFEKSIHIRQLCPSWLRKIPGISDPHDKKLSCMGVTALLVADPTLFNEFSAAYIDTLSMVVDEIPDSGNVVNHFDENEMLTAEEKRQQSYRMNEIVVKVGLKSFISEAAAHIQQNTGDVTFRTAMYDLGIAM